MYCEVCGKQKPSLITVKVGKSYLKVCEDCKVIGTPVQIQETRPIRPVKKVPLTIPKVAKEMQLSIREDYAQEIRKARERMGITQDMLASMLNEKLSIIKKIESGKLKPTIELAKKIEKALKINLLESEEFEEIGSKMSSSKEVTLGDIVEIKED